jgi:hypothetical protein
MTPEDIIATTQTIKKEVHDVATPLEELAMFVPVYGSSLSLAVKLADGATGIILDAVAVFMKANGGDLMLAWAQWIAHNNSRMPNSPLMSGKATDQKSTDVKALPS